MFKQHSQTLPQVKKNQAKAHLTWKVVLTVVEHVQLWLEALSQRSFVQTHVPDCLAYQCRKKGVTPAVELVAGEGEGGNIISTEKMLPHPENCPE